MPPTPRRLATALVVVTILIGPRAAHATPLTVTTGSISFLDLDKLGSFSGDGFSVDFPNNDFAISTDYLFTGNPTSVTFTLWNANVDVGSDQCVTDCGTFTLTSGGMAPMPADWPVDQNYYASTSFTMTGHLNVGPGYDIVGQGVVDGVQFGLVTQHPFGTAGLVQYTFTTPEPSTLLLALVGLGACGVRRRVHP
jgi:hypothetical protein